MAHVSIVPDVRRTRPEVDLSSVVVSEAIGVAADHLRHEFELRDALDVSLRCSARYAAIRVLLGLPKDWTVEEAITTLQTAPVLPATRGEA